MMSTPPIRSISLALLMLMASGAPYAARIEPGLTLDEELRSVTPPAHSADLPTWIETPAHYETPLNLSLTLPPQPASTVVSVTPQAAASTLYRDLLRGLWLVSACLLSLHLVREWARVMRVRVRRPAPSIALEHAPWPAVSILIPLHGDSLQQSNKLDALQSCYFDYPTERIHFVPMFNPADRAVGAAIARLRQAFPDHVHPLPILRDDTLTLAAALHAATANSIGTALVVLDQNTPLPHNWLRESVTPLLDPTVGAVLSRVTPHHNEGALLTRLNRLGDQADALIATQSDALSLLLCGKARIRALRRQAVKNLNAPDLEYAPDGANIVLSLTRLGWQSCLLGNNQTRAMHDAPDVIRSPRMRLSIARHSMQIALLVFNLRVPLGARRQAGAAFFSAALPVIWLVSLLCGIGLYFMHAPIVAGLAITLCAATSFDPRGQPGPAFSIAAAARMAGIRTEIRLLPLSSVVFVDRLVDGLLSLFRARPTAPAPTPVTLVEATRTNQKEVAA